MVRAGSLSVPARDAPTTPSSVLAPLAGVDLPSDVDGKPGRSGFGRKDKLSNRSDKVAEHRAVQR